MSSRTATTTRRSSEFKTVYQRWHEGELDVPMPGGETGPPGARPVPAGASRNCGCATSTTTRGTGDIVVVSHGAAIRLVSAVLAGVDGSFALDHHLGQRRVGRAGADHRRAVELRAVGDADAAVLSRAGCAPGRRMRCSQPTRWADAQTAIATRVARSRRIAVDAECVHHLRGDAVRPRCIRRGTRRGE